jgi:hypothetical protein
VGAFALASAANLRVFQKYFDPFVLLFLFLAVPARPRRPWLANTALAGLLGIFLAYLALRPSVA